MRAMILAAGRGERMRPLTDTLPKPLLPVGGKSLIQWQVERLVAAGTKQLIVNHAWLGAKIEEALGDGSRYGAHITYSPETEALETAGGIVKALPFFDEQPFLVVNGDVWCDWDPTQAKAALAAMQRASAQAWLLLVDNPSHNPAGDFAMDGTGRIYDLAAADAATYTFAGIGLYQPSLFAGLAAGKPAPLAPLLRAAMQAGRVIGAHHAGIWVDVGTPQRLAELDAALGAHS